MAVSERGDDGERNETVALSSEKQQWRRDTYNFTVGICAIVKDGEAYMTEWLDYHLGAMGVDAIYIYDNSFGDPSLELGHDLQAWHRNTRSHPLYSKVEVMHMPEMSTGRQKMAYTDCVLRYGKNVQQLAFDVAEKVGYWNSSSTSPRILDANDGIDYLAMIDIDEFLVPRGNYTSVHGVIKDYLDPYVGGSLTVNWMLFGSSNKTLYSPIPVTKRFQYRDEMPNGVVKSITQASDFGNVAGPHATNTVYGYRRTTLYRGAILENEKGTADPSLPTGALLLYHYRYTSHKEYHYKKCIRMETDGAKGCDYRTGRVITAEELERKGMPDHIAIRTGSVFDDSAWQLLSERVPKYRIYDDEAWVDYS
eukprot:CAMPEP_0181125444 /NCGR_PEP_ID=MMETSP1071-20121207/27055_1 /TAXON_ID=35127 /ORGANISM="Thalassiosira sp., Strain NH16" /LENGTH=364 /DNA_ID=CAMNT_0023210891 /DNA_START=123 /DNA_END=1217 /DNA_ORIENTATION=-